MTMSLAPTATGRVLLGAFYWMFVAYLALPLILVVLVSFKAAPFVGFPLGPLTLEWYRSVLADDAAMRAFIYSAAVALLATALAVFAGTWIAFAIAGLRRGWLRVALLCGGVVPLVTPGIVHAIALRMFIRTIGLDPGPLAVVLGHAVHAAPYVAIMVGARLATMPANLMEAARDLGAGTVGSFVRVAFPWLRPALLGAAVLAALTSFDDFLRSFFLSDYQMTLPVLIYGRLRSGLTPEINAIATLVLLATVALGFAGERLARGAKPQ